jgi:hypothetical protein
MSEPEIATEQDQPKTTIMKVGIVSAVLLVALIILFWYDDFLGFLAALFFVWITIPAVSVFLIAFVKSFRRRSGWHKAMFGCGLGTILLLVAYLLFRAPETRCNPDIMAEHYEKHKAEMEEFCNYMQSVLDDSTSVRIEFKGNRLEMFQVADEDAGTYSGYWDEEAREKRDSLMAVVGLTMDEYNGIRKRLKSMGCIGVEASRITSDCTALWFRRVGMGRYDYVLYSRSLSDEEKEKVLEDYSIIPYNDHVLFRYGSGAIGSDAFSSGTKEKFLKKHAPW